MLDENKAEEESLATPEDLEGGTQTEPHLQLEADTLPATTPLREIPEAHPISAMRANGADPSDEPFIHFAQRCDLGVVRRRNEDSSFTFVSQTGGQEPLLPFALCLVADGMGGHHAGHEASRRVAHHFAQHVMNRIYLPLMRNESSQEPIRDIMLQAVEEANKRLHTNDPDKEGGTTLTAALVIGRRLYLVHVGDSRAYMLNEGELQPLTTDHSVVQRLQDSGQITAEEAAIHPHRNLLYRALTGGELDEIETFTRSLPKEGTLLLCSDGLWGSVSDQEMKNILSDSNLSLQDKVENLVQEAIAGGSTDNITAIIMDFKL